MPPIEEPPRERLRKAIANKRQQRTSAKAAAPEQQGQQRTVTRSQTIDSILESLGIPTSDTQTKKKLVRAMRSGAVTNVNQLSEWLALNAPISTGLAPSQALAVNNMLAQATASANTYTDRIVGQVNSPHSGGHP